MTRMTKATAAVCSLMAAAMTAATAYASGTEEPIGQPFSAVEQIQPPSGLGAPQDSTGILEGAYDTAGGDDWNWKEDPAVKVDAAVSDSITLPCRNAILVSSDTGEVLYEMNSDDQVPIASITKVMTLLLTFEAIEAGRISLQDHVPISEHAYSMGGSQIWLEPGEVFTLDEMVKAICVSSANDAAVAVAEYIGGTEQAFANMMNERAAALGMTNTQFKNACGLDEEGHYSTARDVAVMSLELMKHPKAMEYASIWTDSLRNGATQLVNTNKMLRSYQGTTGLKTGTTSGAGVCISASAEREDMGLLAVVLGSPSSAERFAAAQRLLDYGFAQYESAPFPPVQGLTEEIAVTGGVQDIARIHAQTPARILVKKGQTQGLQATVQLPQQLQAPLRSGDPVAQIVLSSESEELARYPVTIAGDIECLTRERAWGLLWKGLLKAG